MNVKNTMGGFVSGCFEGAAWSSGMAPWEALYIRSLEGMLEDPHLQQNDVGVPGNVQERAREWREKTTLYGDACVDLLAQHPSLRDAAQLVAVDQNKSEDEVTVQEALVFFGQKDGEASGEVTAKRWRGLWAEVEAARVAVEAAGEGAGAALEATLEEAKKKAQAAVDALRSKMRLPALWSQLERLLAGNVGGGTGGAGGTGGTGRTGGTGSRAAYGSRSSPPEIMMDRPSIMVDARSFCATLMSASVR